MRPSSPTFDPASWLAPDPRRPRSARLQKEPLLASPLPGPSFPASGPAPALHSPLPPAAAPALPHLAVRVDHRAEQLPGAAAAVHAHHAQDLQEAHAAQRRRGKDVTLRARGDDRHRGHEHDEVCRSEGGDVTAGAEEPTRPASVPRPAGGEQPGGVRCGQGRLRFARKPFCVIGNKACPAILGNGSSSQRTRPGRCTPGRTPRSSRIPVRPGPQVLVSPLQVQVTQYRSSSESLS